jgi:hypothetical protein
MSGRFDALSDGLLLRGIAPRHVRRYVRELEEHFADLVSEGMAEGVTRVSAEVMAQGRIGRTEDLIEAMAARKELQSWIGRMPQTMLLAAPPLVLILIMIVQMFGFGTLVENFGGAPYQWGGRLPPEWLHPIMKWTFHFDNFLLPILLGWVFAAASLRQRLGKGWMTGGLLLMSLISGALIAHLQWPSNPTDHWSFSFGLPIGQPLDAWSGVFSRIIASFILTASPFWFLFHRPKKVT